MTLKYVLVYMTAPVDGHVIDLVCRPWCGHALSRHDSAEHDRRIVSVGTSSLIVSWCNRGVHLVLVPVEKPL